MKTEQSQPTTEAAGWASDVERVVRLHTIGPWTLKADEEIVYGTSREGEHIVVVYELGTNEADGKLIAAAPDLLAALMSVVSISDRKHDAWDAAKAAINKALGNA